MSHVKDSSLARSRIKRSHRVPARLADFREFPQDSLQSTPKSNPAKKANTNESIALKNNNKQNTTVASTATNITPTSNSSTSSGSIDIKSANTNGTYNYAALKSPSKPAINNQQQQQAKYITNQIPNQVTPSMQYGTRFLINEPVCLPRNVSNIAPISTNLQQIENYVRKLPFLSYKAQLCTNYYQQRLMNSMTSNYDALIRIASHLEVVDLLKLRLVSKCWKSIIDSDAVWQRVVIEKSNIKNWNDFGEWLYRKGTKHLHLKNMIPSLSWFKVCEYFKGPYMKLESLLIESNDGLQNRYIMELLCVLNNNTNNKLNVHWKVKGLVNDIGLIQIDLKTRKKSCMMSEFERDFYCYNAHPNLLSDTAEHIMFDLYDIEDLFNDNSTKYLPERNPSKGAHIMIEAV